LDNEIRYLWVRRRFFTLGGVLLFLCRYIPFASALEIYVFITTTNLNPSHCLAGIRASTCVVYIEFILSVFVLFARAYAVWGGSSSVLRVLALVYAGGIAGTSYSVFLYIRGVSSLEFSLSNGCLFDIANDDLNISVGILLFCESLALCLLIIKAVQYARALNEFNRSNNSRKHLLLVMTEDGIGYFVCTLAISTANLVVLKRVSPALREFLFVTQGAILGILCSRLLFHVHAVNEFPDGTYLSQLSRSVPMIRMSPQKSENGSNSIDTFESNC